MMQQEADVWQQNLEDLPQSVMNDISTMRKCIQTAYHTDRHRSADRKGAISSEQDRSQVVVSQVAAASLTTVFHLTKSLLLAISAIAAVKRVRDSDLVSESVLMRLP